MKKDKVIVYGRKLPAAKLSTDTKEGILEQWLIKMINKNNIQSFESNNLQEKINFGIKASALVMTLARLQQLFSQD